jgi:prolyl 4-hydroxylase
MKKITNNFNEDVWIIENFWDQKVCKDIIDDLNESNLFEKENISLKPVTESLEINLENRNQNRIIYESDELALEIWKDLIQFNRIDSVIRNAKMINKSFRFYKYSIGQEFLPHTDHPCNPAPNLKSNFSLLIYLNDDFEGGDTIFENIKVKPKQGSAVFFRHEILHSSSKITEGIKFILRTDVVSEIDKI